MELENITSQSLSSSSSLLHLFVGFIHFPPLFLISFFPFHYYSWYQVQCLDTNLVCSISFHLIEFNQKYTRKVLFHQVKLIKAWAQHLEP